MRVGIRSTTQLRAKDIRERINKWDFTEIKSFCMAKENSTKLQREPTVWENIFVMIPRRGSDLQNMYRTHMTPL